MIFIYLGLYLILDHICKANGWDKPSHSHSHQDDESYAMATAITDEEAFYDAFK